MEDSIVSETILSPKLAANGANGSAGQPPQGDEAETGVVNGGDGAPLSKNQQKKLKKRQFWEERKDDRKRRRKEKKQDRQARRWVEKQTKIAEAKAAGLNPEEVLKAEKPVAVEKLRVPVSLILDCDFEEYMRDQELVSLASQITRCYAQNRSARYRSHLFISSWGGKLKTRYETVLNNHHKHWQHVHFVEDDFVAAAQQARELMKGPDGGSLIDVLQGDGPDGQASGSEPQPRTPADTTPVPDAESGVREPSVVYLTSESPYTLEKLEPYTSYVIGGIVDKNREKGLCYKRAKERGVRTAKLPIGDYMVMASRQVLTTNQVVEIMLGWLETGDWAVAFSNAIPKRKGGRLKGELVASEAGEDQHQKSDESGDEEDDNEASPQPGETREPANLGDHLVEGDGNQEDE